MRASFPKIVEAGRQRKGPMATQTGDTWGFFFVKHPRNGKRFKVMVGDGDGWDHVSVSVGHGKNLKARCPTWDEMCWIKSLFFTGEETAMQLHPPASDYVNDHPACLHLWRPHGIEIPRPPPIMIGYGRKQPEAQL